MELAASISDETEFDEEQIDGGVEMVCVENNEDLFVAMAYIAECYTFNRNVDLELFNVERERSRMLDLLM